MPEYDLKLTGEEVNEIIRALAAPVVAGIPLVAKLTQQMMTQQQQKESSNGAGSSTSKPTASSPARPRSLAR